MASIYQRKGRKGWTTDWAEDGRRRQRQFKTEGVARVVADVVEDSGIFSKLTRLLRSLEKPGSEITLSGLEILLARMPFVYVWSRDGQVLYVGKAESGLGRLVDPTHHRLREILLTDSVRIIRCASGAAAVEVERRLIAELRPLLNGPSVMKTATPV